MKASAPAGRISNDLTILANGTTGFSAKTAPPHCDRLLRAVSEPIQSALVSILKGPQRERKDG